MANNLDYVFEAFASEKRRSIINTLGYRPATVSQLASENQLSLPAIHKHIKILERAKLIRNKKVGRTKFLAFERDAMEEAQNWIMQYNTAWGSNNETLENYIASLENGHKASRRSVKY